MAGTKRHPYLLKKQIKAIREKLLAEKERILNKFDIDEARYHMDKEELSDPVDEASANVQASQEIRFRNRENFYLKKINKTLTRIDEVEFGMCEECDGEIGFERLVARPTADMCIACKEEAEADEKSNAFLKRSKSLGKALHEMGRV